MTDPIYVPLRLYSPYTLTEGMIFPARLVERLSAWNIPAAGISDRNTLAGAYSLNAALHKGGVQLLQGIEIEIDHPGLADDERDTSRIVLYAPSEEGYEQIHRFSSHVNCLHRPLPIEQLLDADLSRDILALTGGLQGPVDRAYAQKQPERAARRLKALARAFKDRLHVEIQRQDRAAPWQGDMISLANQLGLPCLATSHASFLERDEHEAQDVLLCIADKMTVAHENRRHADPAAFLKSPAEMAELFRDIPEALSNTVEFARRCHFSIEKKKPTLPAFPTRDNKSEEDELRRQARDGLEARLKTVSFDDEDKTPFGHSRSDYLERLESELDVIISMGFPGYFLIVADFIGWAKLNDIPVGPGRGSGAGSLVAWALTITDLDPLRYGLFFERFLNPERVSMPDFDIDFCRNRREEVIDYVRGKYGRDRVAQIGTLGTLHAHAALRDAGRTLQVPFPVVDRFARLIPQEPGQHITVAEALDMEVVKSALVGADEQIHKMFSIAQSIEGLYRNQSTHAAGVVIGNKAIDQIVPTYRDGDDALVTSFDMKSVENAGLVKFDFLGLKTLDVIQNAQEIAARAGTPIEIDSINADDSETYKMLCAGESYGVFQLESEGMRQAMVQIQPTSIEDIVALVSLYRPGPMENIPTYANVKAGREPASYLHPIMEPTLRETYGIIVYQEQVMQLARDLAGYSLGGADMLRRAMGKKIASEMEAQRAVFSQGAQKQGIDPAVASEIFDLIAKFANYGFNKSHAAAYAVIAYQTAFLRRHRLEAFLCATMNLDIEKTDKVAVSLADARRKDIPILRPDINSSTAQFDVEMSGPRPAIRYGLGAISGIGQSMIDLVVKERDQSGPFSSLENFVTRCREFINPKLVDSLIRSGALDGLHANRAAMIEAFPGFMRKAKKQVSDRARGQASMFDLLPQEADTPLPTIPDWSPIVKMQAQFKVLGSYLDGHPVEILRKQLQHYDNNTTIATLQSRRRNFSEQVSLGVIIYDMMIKQTAKKETMVVLKLSDDTGMIEAVAYRAQAEQVISALREADVPVARLTLSVEKKGERLSLFLREFEMIDPSLL